MPKRNRASMQSRIILFVAIIGLAMLGAALLLHLSPPGESAGLSDRNLRATAEALDGRATEIAVAAIRLLAPLPATLPGTVTPPAREMESAPATSWQVPVAWGESWATPDGLRVRVVSVNEDAWEAVRAENQFNEPPAEGMRMVLVGVEVTNVSGDANTPRKVDDSLPGSGHKSREWGRRFGRFPEDRNRQLI